MAGRARTHETEQLRRKRISETKRGVPRSAATRAKISATMSARATESLLYRAASRHREEI